VKTEAIAVKPGTTLAVASESKLPGNRYQTGPEIRWDFEASSIERPKQKLVDLLLCGIIRLRQLEVQA
jgi:hypothetical protein